MASLKSYHSKRDFAVSREPRGKHFVGRSKHRFVIQRHAATRLHYDLRLELTGVYKSWAVTKTPSLDPAVKRLAVEVEDHPLEYGTFEGTIPKGQYGGGTVQLWDRGTWRPESSDPEAQFAKGNLKFELQGTRMRGKWALIRMRDRDKPSPRHNWLLIKEIDDEAKRGSAGDTLAAAVTSVKTGRTLEEIAAKSKKTWNSNRSNGATKSKKTPAVPLRVSNRAKALAVKMPPFVAPQLCRLRDQPPSGSDWVHEVKFDGYRVLLRVERHEASLRTRSGEDWSHRFAEIARDAAALGDCLLDGEVCALNKEGISDFGLLQLALSERSTAGLVYFAFDILFAEGIDLRHEPLAKRKETLEQVLKATRNSKRMRFVQHFDTAGQDVLNAACKIGLEGVVSKRLDAPYRSGRGDAWVKSKCRGGQEVVVGGWRGTGTKLRSLLVGAYKGDKLAYLGRVGTGYSAPVAADLLARLKPLATDVPAFSGAPRLPDINWVKPKLVAEVEFENITSDGLLRQAAFKGLRLDKPAHTVTLEMSERGVRAIPKAAAKGSKKAEKNDVLGVVITHPEKELWPKSKLAPAVTKLDLARYMAAAAPRILPHIEQRPISVVRAPDGISGQKFFQRHPLKGTAVPVLEIKVKGEPQPYLGIDSAAALVALAQQAVVEFHPWGSARGDPDSPERIILDLDPAPDVPFSAVIQCALELRRRLVQLRLVPFVKTTGGKGLHVVIPIKAGSSWAEAKAFAKAVALGMERDRPDSYTVTVAKKARTGKIFIDYLRNDRTSTGVAPWSPRARDGAPIAMPVTWGQLNSRLQPLRYTIATSGTFLKKPDPWKDLAKSARPLGPAVKKLLA